MSELFEVDLGPPLSFEIPALLLSVLATPKPGETRDDLYESICIWLIQQRCMREPDWSRVELPVKPLLFTVSERDRRSDFRTLEGRLRHRISAGHMAIAFLMEAASGELPELPNGVTRLSINQMAAAMAEELGLSDAGNVESRIWRPSLPVLHLCAALATRLNLTRQQTGRLPGIDELYGDNGLLPAVLEAAEQFEDLLEKCRLKIAAEKLVRFRVLRVGSKTD